jgi:hypothetical protein
LVELKRYEIATLPSSGLRAGLSVARNDNLAAGGGHRRLSGHDLLFLCADVQADLRAGTGEVYREEIETLLVTFLSPFIGREGSGEGGEATPFSVDKLKFVD